MPRADVIPELAFRHNDKPGLGFEIITLASLYERQLDLISPKRLEFHMVCVGLAGKGEQVIDFEPASLGAGYATVVARGRVHRWPPERRGVDAWLVLIEPSFLELGARDPLRGAAVLSPTLATPALALGEAREEILALAAQLAAEQARPLDAMQPAVLDALVRALLLRLERLVHGQTALPPTDLARFYAALERDCTRTRSVAHYAKASGISARRLGELLVGYAGKSTKQVIDDRVLLEHKRLLAHTELTVKELAEQTGFDEPTNLVKFFKQRAGMTPLEFRESTFLPSGRRGSPRPT